MPDREEALHEVHDVRMAEAAVVYDLTLHVAGEFVERPFDELDRDLRLLASPA